MKAHACWTTFAAVALATSLASPSFAADAFRMQRASAPSAASELAQRHAAQRRDAPIGRGHVLATGITRPAWFALHLVSATFRPGESARFQPLALEQGRRVLEFPIGEDAVELFVRVAGQVEFERAIIGFSDGGAQDVDAFGAVRDAGFYRLADFGDGRAIAWVRLVLRARSKRAHVGVLIGR